MHFRLFFCRSVVPKHTLKIFHRFLHVPQYEVLDVLQQYLAHNVPHENSDDAQENVHVLQLVEALRYLGGVDGACCTTRAAAPFATAITTTAAAAPTAAAAAAAAAAAFWHRSFIVVAL